MLDTNTQPQNAVTLDQDFLEKISNPEVQASLNALVDKLPQLTEMVDKMTQAYGMLSQLASDDVFRSDIAHATSEIVGPIVEGARTIAINAVEAKDRAETNDEMIGIFGLVKMLKDPQLQKMFRFMHAYLQVSNERASK